MIYFYNFYLQSHWALSPGLASYTQKSKVLKEKLRKLENFQVEDFGLGWKEKEPQQSGRIPVFLVWVLV